MADDALQVKGRPTLSSDGNTVFVTSEDKLLRAVNTADGTIRWTSDQLEDKV